MMEEFSHILDSVAGRQDQAVVQDPSSGEKGLESLGKPANTYFKEKYVASAKDIQLGSNATNLKETDLGTHVGDHPGVLLWNPYTAIAAGIGVIGYELLPEEKKEVVNQAIVEAYGKSKQSISESMDRVEKSFVFYTILQRILLQKGIKEGEVIFTENAGAKRDYILSELPEDMRDQKLPPMPSLETKKPTILDTPFHSFPKETPQEKREGAEKAKKEAEKFNELLRGPHIFPRLFEKTPTIMTIGIEDYNSIFRQTGVSSNNVGKGISSKVLREELLKGVQEPNYRNAAHHLVSDKGMEEAKDILDSLGIDINSPANGVFLPTTGAKDYGDAAVHIGRNGKFYKEIVKNRIVNTYENAYEKYHDINKVQEEVIKELHNIRKELLEGELKINNARLKE